MAGRAGYLAALGVTDWRQRRPLAVQGKPREVLPPAPAPVELPAIVAEGEIIDQHAVIFREGRDAPRRLAGRGSPDVAHAGRGFDPGKSRPTARATDTAEP